MDSIIDSFLDLKLTAVVFDQVIDVVQVELEETYANSKLSDLHLLLNLGEDMRYCPMEVAFFVTGVLGVLAAEDGVSLASARLSIGQECGIEALKD